MQKITTALSRSCDAPSGTGQMLVAHPLPPMSLAGGLMDRGIRAALSPNEAHTLCRIAADMAPRAMLAARDVAQRLKLQLVREEQVGTDGHWAGAPPPDLRHDRPRRSVRRDQRGALSP